MKITKRKSWILKRLHFHFTKISPAFSKSESSDRNSLFSRNGNIKSAFFTTFSILCAFSLSYRFIDYSIFPIAISSFSLSFNFRPIWHPETLTFYCSQNHLQIPSSEMSCLQHDVAPLSRFVTHKKIGEQKFSYFGPCFKK